MKFYPDLSLVIPSNSIIGEDHEETQELQAMLQEATDFVSDFNWCVRVLDSYMGIGVGGVVAVFLMHLEPASPNADDWIWVIVGDLPPAYITLDNAKNAASALHAYIAEMRAWVKAVRDGQVTDEIIPVNAPPTLDNALELEGRLNFLCDKVLLFFGSELKG